MLQIEKGVKSKAVSNILDKSLGLSALWQSRIASKTGKAPNPLIPKEHGQLKRLKESLGMEKATQVIDFVINRWQEFGNRAKIAHDSAAVPDKPQIGFLLKYHAAALMMLTETQAKQKVEDEKMKKAAQATIEKEVSVMKPQHKPMTLIQLSPQQEDALFSGIMNEVDDGFSDALTEMYGEWRPAHSNEKGIPFPEELKLALAMNQGMEKARL